MAVYSKFLSLISGVQSTVDLSTNTLNLGALQIGGVNLDGTSGSTLVGDSNTYSNFTPSAATVKGALAGIDTALATSGSTTFSDSAFAVYDNGDATKIMKFEVSGISTATTRTVTMPDSNVDLGKIATAIQRDGSVAHTANQPMGGFKLTGLAAGTTAGDSVRYEQAILASGVNAFAANQPMGGFKLTGLAAGSGAGDSVRYEQAILITGANAFTANQSLGTNKLTNVGDPTAAQDAATKAYVDAVALGLSPKKAVRVASTANITIASALINGATVDGITLATGDRVLLKDQTAPAENGIYIVAASGAASRSTDMDSLTPIDEVNGAWVPVQLGTVNAGRVYVQYGLVSTLGTDAVNFEFYNPLAALSGGDMITVSGSTISVDLATVSGLESTNPGNAAGQLRIKLEASNPSLKFSGSNELGAKLDAAGAITSGASGLIVGVDASTIEISSNALRIKDAGVTLAKHASNSVDENKIVSTTMSASGAITGGSGTKLAVAVDGSSIEISSNALRIKSTAYDGTSISGGGGAAASVLSAPKVQSSMTAGETFAANTSFLVRWAINGETADRVYKGDNSSATPTSYNYYVIGIAQSTSSVSAGNPITVISRGSLTLGSSDTPFSSGDIGKPVYLTTTGGFSITPPSASSTAVVRVGIVESTSKIWVDASHLNGLN